MAYKLTIDGKDVTAYAESITWGGDIDDGARSLSAEFARGILPECGDKARLYVGGKLIYSGYVTDVDRDAWGTSIDSSDAGMYLSKNYLYKEYKGTPQTITRKVCAECGIKIGKLAEKKGVVKVTSSGSKSAYSVIEEAYEGERQKAKQYCYFIKSGRLYVEAVGSSYVGKLAAEIETVKRGWSIKDMVNRVVIIDDSGKVKGEVQNAADRHKYGTMQKTYTKQKDKNAEAEAKDILRRLQKSGTITAIGNISMVAGKKIKVIEKQSGMSAYVAIKSDKHTFSAGDHSMSLEVYYEAK